MRNLQNSSLGQGKIPPPPKKRKHPHLKALRSFRIDGLRKEEPRSQTRQRSSNCMRSTQSLGGVSKEKKEMLLRKEKSHPPLTHHGLASRIHLTRRDSANWSVATQATLCTRQIQPSTRRICATLQRRQLNRKQRQRRHLLRRRFRKFAKR